MTDHRTEDDLVWRICRHVLPDYGHRMLLAYQSKNSAWTHVLIGTRSHTDQNGEHWNDDRDDAIADSVEVFAWMPLPKVTSER